MEVYKIYASAPTLMRHGLLVLMGRRKEAGWSSWLRRMRWMEANLFHSRWWTGLQRSWLESVGLHWQLKLKRWLRRWTSWSGPRQCLLWWFGQTKGQTMRTWWSGLVNPRWLRMPEHSMMLAIRWLLGAKACREENRYRDQDLCGKATSSRRSAAMVQQPSTVGWWNDQGVGSTKAGVWATTWCPLSSLWPGVHSFQEGQEWGQRDGARHPQPSGWGVWEQQEVPRRDLQDRGHGGWGERWMPIVPSWSCEGPEEDGWRSRLDDDFRGLRRRGWSVRRPWVLLGPWVCQGVCGCLRVWMLSNDRLLCWSTSWMAWRNRAWKDDAGSRDHGASWWNYGEECSGWRG